jgi:hypothetical protein
MKKSILLIIVLTLFSACDSGSPVSTGFKGVDRTQPIASQYQALYDNLEPDTDFYGLTVKAAVQTEKFVGSWSGWLDRQSHLFTFNADGSCEDKSYFHLKHHETLNDCRKWYNVTLADDTDALLILYGNGRIVIYSYGFEDENNFYMRSYSSGAGMLVTRTDSDPIAANYIERPLLGTWIQKGYKEDYYWDFTVDHHFKTTVVRKEDKETLYGGQGTWQLLNGTLLTKLADIRNKEEEALVIKSAPPSTLDLNYLHSAENIIIRREHLAEPIMIKSDPYIGRFQKTHHYITTNSAMTLLIKKDGGDYLVDIYWNGSIYNNQPAQIRGGLLHIKTHIGTINLKAVVGGVQIDSISRLKDASDKNTFNFSRRMLRVSQKPITTTAEPQIIGKWVQESEGEEYSENRSTTQYRFYDDGTFFFTTVLTDPDMQKTEEGSYRIKNNNKLYFKGHCQKEESFHSIKLNTEQFSITIPHGIGSYNLQETTFMKLPKSAALSKIEQANSKFLHDAAVKLRPHPDKEGKYLFDTAYTYNYSNSLSGISIGYDFTPSGKVYTTYLVMGAFGSVNGTNRTYYIQAKLGEAEKIIIVNNDGKEDIIPLYENRSKMCSGTFEMKLKPKQ